MSRTDSAINAKYYRLSSCRRYSVCEIRLADQVRYEAWVCPISSSAQATWLGSFEKPQTAKNHCQRHADKREAQLAKQAA